LRFRLFFPYAVTMNERTPATDTMLVMAALIAAVRTARRAVREFQGAYSPKVVGEVMNALALARLICRRAQEQR
jgi:hypothetical protein